MAAAANAARVLRSGFGSASFGIHARRQAAAAARRGIGSRAPAAARRRPKRAGGRYVRGSRRSYRRPRISVRRGPPLIPSLEFQNTYKNTFSDDFQVTTTGLCSWKEAGRLFDVADMEILSAESRKFIPFITTSIQGENVSDAKDKNIKILSCKYKMMFKNQSSTTCKMTIYACCCKMDGDESQEPIQLINEGLLQQQAAAGAFLIPTTKPQDSREFNAMWRVKQQKSFIFQAGESKDVYWDLGRSAINGMQHSQHLSEGHKFTAGRTILFLVKLSGEVSHSVALSSDIALGFANVDMVAQRTYRYSFKPFNQPRSLITDFSESFVDPEGFNDNDIVDQAYAGE